MRDLRPRARELLLRHRDADAIIPAARELREHVGPIDHVRLDRERAQPLDRRLRSDAAGLEEDGQSHSPILRAASAVASAGVEAP